MINMISRYIFGTSILYIFDQIQIVSWNYKIDRENTTIENRIIFSLIISYYLNHLSYTYV